MSSFFSAILGVLAGIMTGTALEWWKASRGNLASSCDLFCDLVADASDVGAQFWVTPGSATETPLLIAKLAGFQCLIDGYLMLVATRLHDDAIASITDSCGAFFKALTGANSDDPQRPASRDAAIQVKTAASNAILTIRRAAYEKFSPSEAIRRNIWKPLSEFYGSDG